MTKKEWVSNAYIHEEDDPPECHFCGKVAEYDDEIAESCYLSIYCCDDTNCTVELGEMSKESYFTLEGDDDDEQSETKSKK